MPGRTRLLLWSLLVLVASSAFVVDFSRPRYSLEHVRELGGLYYATDLSIRGVHDLVGIEVIDSDSGFTTIHRKGAEGLTDKSVVIPGTFVDILPIDESQVGESRFAVFTRNGDSLFSSLIYDEAGTSISRTKPELLYTRNDCRVDGSRFPWIPGMQSATRLTDSAGADAGTLVVTIARRTGAPRGLFWLDSEGHLDGDPLEFGAQIGSSAWSLDRTTLYAGTWTPDNECVRGGLSDTTAQILVLDVVNRTIKESIVVEDQVGSAVTVFAVESSPGEQVLYAAIASSGGAVGGVYPISDLRFGDLASPDADGWSAMTAANWQEDGSQVIVASNLNGRLATIGLENEFEIDLVGEARVGLGTAGDLDGDGWEELYFATTQGTHFLARSGKTVVETSRTASQWEPVATADGGPPNLLARDPISNTSALYTVIRNPLMSTAELARLAVLFLLLGGASIGYKWSTTRLMRETEDAEIRHVRELARLSLIENQESISRNLLAALEAHHTNADLGIPDLADAAGFASATEMGKIIKCLTGLTSREFVEEYRMARARNLLVKGEHTVEAISKMVGFRSAGYFSTRFKKAHGISPSEHASTPN